MSGVCLEFIMKPRHVAALVFGCLLLLLGLGMAVGGGAVGVFELAARDDGGWHSVDINRLDSSGVAVTSEGAMVRIDGPSWVTDRLDMQMRLQVTPVDSAEPVFVGVAPSADLAAYLSGAAHDVVSSVSVRGVPTYRFVPGAASVAAPATQTFWDVSSTGASTREVTWTLRSGTWTVAVLNASGTSGVAVSAVAAIRAGSALPIGVGIFIAGLFVGAAGVALVVAGARGARPSTGVPAYGPPSSGTPSSGTPAYGPQDSEHPVPMARIGILPSPDRPLVLEARLAPDLSRWFWLVKWFLAIPHYVVLFALWLAYGVSLVCAWFAILFTGRYPRGLFDFNVGVLRWTWRVGYYVSWGGMGTDRYPPFTLHALPEDDARLDVAYPEHLSRGLIFVKWLLLLPHWIVIAVIVGTQSRTDDNGVQVGGWPGLLSLLAFVAGVVLLVTGSYAVGLFDVIVGLNRWVFRVLAYASLMTDVYPPFRYDGGGLETAHHGPPGPAGPPVSTVPPDAEVPPAEPNQREFWHHTPSS